MNDIDATSDEGDHIGYGDLRFGGGGTAEDAAFAVPPRSFGVGPVGKPTRPAARAAPPMSMGRLELTSGPRRDSRTPMDQAGPTAGTFSTSLLVDVGSARDWRCMGTVSAGCRYAPAARNEYASAEESCSILSARRGLFMLDLVLCHPAAAPESWCRAIAEAPDGCGGCPRGCSCHDSPMAPSGAGWRCSTRIASGPHPIVGAMRRITTTIIATFLTMTHAFLRSQLSCDSGMAPPIVPLASDPLSRARPDAPTLLPAGRACGGRSDLELMTWFLCARR